MLDVLSSIAEQLSDATAGDEAYVIGGAVRDELLGREIIDIDVACAVPRQAANRLGRSAQGAVFLLSERHGAWRVALRNGRTVDFVPLGAGIEHDLAARDFTVNAIAKHIGHGEIVDPHGGVADLKKHRLREVSPSVFLDDPLRLLRAVRLEDELGLVLDETSTTLVREHARLVRNPAGERLIAELARLSPAGYRRAGELGLLEPLGGDAGRLDDVELIDEPNFLLVVVLRDALFELPISNETRRFGKTLLTAKPPEDDSPRQIYRFRRPTEPWAVEALAFLGINGDLVNAVERARLHEPAEPLVRGDELGIPAGPEIGRILERIAEEHASGTIGTKEEALEFVRRARS